MFTHDIGICDVVILTIGRISQCLLQSPSARPSTMFRMTENSM